MKSSEAKIPTNHVESFAVLEEPDDTKPGKPLHLIEIFLSNYNGESINSRMNIGCAMALVEQISKQVRKIVERYPVSDRDTR